MPWIIQRFNFLNWLEKYFALNGIMLLLYVILCGISSFITFDTYGEFIYLYNSPSSPFSLPFSGFRLSVSLVKTTRYTNEGLSYSLNSPRVQAITMPDTKTNTARIELPPIFTGDGSSTQYQEQHDQGVRQQSLVVLEIFICTTLNLIQSNRNRFLISMEVNFLLHGVLYIT